MERQLGEVERCRAIYGKFVEAAPTNCRAWTGFGELEATVGESERARAVYELAISQQALDMPETVWKAYIDFEICKEKEPDDDDDEEGAGATASAAAEGAAPSRVSALYERLLERTKHVKVYISWAQFESAAGEVERARKVFQDANTHFKSAGAEHKVLHPPRAALQMPRPRVRGGQPSCGGRDRRSG